MCLCYRADQHRPILGSSRLRSRRPKLISFYLLRPTDARLVLSRPTQCTEYLPATRVCSRRNFSVAIFRHINLVTVTRTPCTYPCIVRALHRNQGLRSTVVTLTLLRYMSQSYAIYTLKRPYMYNTAGGGECDERISR